MRAQELSHSHATITRENDKQSIKFLLNSPTPPVYDVWSSSGRSDSEASSIDDIISVAHFLVRAAFDDSTVPDSTLDRTQRNTKVSAFSSISNAHGVPFADDKSRGVQKQRKKRPSVSCNICGRIFVQPGAMRKHKRVVHDKIKDFECGICQRPFAEKSNLKKHILAKHQRKRFHKCKECNKMFNFTDGLRRHINNCHLGLRPYECDICSSAFKQQTHMQNHRQKIHKDARE